MTVRELAQNLIDNDREGTPTVIDLARAAQLVGWMVADDSDGDLPEDLTPESFMEAWNDIIKGE